MFQCLVCEDWFHEKCIGEGRVPDQDDFDGFVCRDCVGTHEWLGRYVSDRSASMSTLETYPEGKVDIETVDETPVPPPDNAVTAVTSSSSERADGVPTAQESLGVKRNLSAEPELVEPSSKRVKLETEPEPTLEPCKWSTLPPTPPGPFALFMKEHFRNHLCRCIACETLRLRALPMISHEEETYEPDEDNSDTGLVQPLCPFLTLCRLLT